MTKQKIKSRSLANDRIKTPPIRNSGKESSRKTQKTSQNIARHNSNPGRTKKRTSKRPSSPKRFATYKKSLKPSYKKGSTSFSSKNKLKIIVLGGLEEVGRNMTLLEYENDIIIIDMGIMFPEESMPGVDYVIPNIDYLRGKEKNIRGVVITHGHMDHIGAIPHLMGDLGNPPVYTGKLSAGLILKRQEEYRQSPKLSIIVIDEKSKLKLGKNFEVEFFRVNHTIPDSFGIAINTPTGLVIHTGDFKFDHNPVNDHQREHPSFYNELL